MSFATGFIGGAANELMNERNANAQAAQDQINNMIDVFDKQTMPLYRKQSQEADNAATNVSRLMAIDGMDPNVALNAVSSPSFDMSKANITDLLNQSKTTRAKAASNSANGGGNSSQQTSMANPAAVAQNQAAANPQPAQTGTAPVQSSTQGAAAQPAQQSQQPQSITPPITGNTPQSSQGAATNLFGTGSGQSPQGQQQGSQQAPQGEGTGLDLPTLNKIGDLLLGRVGTDQVRQQFLDQAKAKYGIDEGQVLQIIKQANTGQKLPTAAPGTVSNAPTQNDLRDNASTVNPANYKSQADYQSDLKDLQNGTAPSRGLNAQDKSNMTLAQQEAASSVASKQQLANSMALAKYNNDLKQANLNSSNTQWLGDAGLTGQSYLDSIKDPHQKIAVQMLGDYKLPLPSQRVLYDDNGNLNPTAEAALHYNPNFQAQRYQAVQKAVNSWDGDGKSSQAIQNIVTGVNHLELVKQLAATLDNGDIPAFNKLANAADIQTGGTNVTSLRAAIPIVSREIVRATMPAGSQSTGEERKQEEQNMASSLTPGQMEGVIKAQQGLLAGRLDANRRAYENATGLNDFDKYLSPIAKKTLEGVSASGKIEGEATNANQVAPTQNPVPNGTVISNGWVYDAVTHQPLGKAK